MKRALTFLAALLGAMWYAGRTLRRLGQSDPFDVWTDDSAETYEAGAYPPMSATPTYMDRSEPVMD
jgi:hypothetical protein